MKTKLIENTNRNTEIVYGLDEFVSYKNGRLVLTLNRDDVIRLSVYSKQNDSNVMLLDLGYALYTAGENIIQIGNLIGRVGVKLTFLERFQYFNDITEIVSSYKNNPTFASVDFSPSEGSFIGTFNDQAELDAITNATPGDYATTRDGGFFVFKEGV